MFLRLSKQHFITTWSSGFSGFKKKENSLDSVRYHVVNLSCLTPPGKWKSAAPTSTMACIPKSSQRAASGTGAPVACFPGCTHRAKGAERWADECAGWCGQSQDQSSPQHQCGRCAKVRNVHINTYQPSLVIQPSLAIIERSFAWQLFK